MEQSPLIEIGLPLALMIIMAGMGLGLTLGDFRQVVARPKAMFVGTIAQVVFIPLLAFGLAELMGLSPAIAVGLVIIASCPGGTTSNIFTLLARGNVALSIALTVLASIITIVTIPLFTNLALDMHSMEAAEQVVRLPVLRTVLSLSVVIVLPVLIGMFVRHRSLSFAQKVEPHVGKFGMFVLVLLIAGIVYGTRNEILSLIAQAGPAAAALNLVGIAAGFASSKLFGVSRADGLTIAIEVGIKNATVGLMITLTFLKSAEIAIPSAVYGILMFAFGGLLVLFGRRQSPAPSRVSLPQ
jgi:BASS family bile acid:Na+ symporter